MSDKYFGPFNKKLKSKDVIDVGNFYSDNDFAEMYDYSLPSSNNDSDLNLILNSISIDERILEVGSGNGRIFNPLSENGYDIYGLEPEIEMSSYIKEEFRHKVFNFGIDRISELSHHGIKKIIIPATTISLFSRLEFEKLIKESREVLPYKGSILFDFLISNEDYGKINHLHLGDKKYFYSNYFEKPYVFLNAYVEYGDIKKIGYSKKYLYDLSYVKDVVEKNEMSLHVIHVEKDYIFVEVKNE